jgi:hypothetical protein
MDPSGKAGALSRRRRRTTRRWLGIGGVVAALAVSAAGALTAVSAVPARAVEGGSPVVGGNVPWIASVQTLQGQQVCGGTLVSDRWLLTAFHCVVQAAPQTLQVRIGSLDRTRGGDLAGVAKIVADPDARFDPTTRTISGTDLALIELDRPVRERTLRLVRDTPAVGAPLRLLGWGAICGTDGCGFPRRLQQVLLARTADQRCGLADSAPGPDVPRLCAIADGKGASAGDSGGPVLSLGAGGWRLAGVVSAAGDIGATEHLSVFTSVEPNRAWIDHVIRLLPAGGCLGQPRQRERVRAGADAHQPASCH